MTALTENRYTRFRDGLVSAHPVKANTKIYKGSLVCADGGYAVPGADRADYVFLGVALEEADSTDGVDGQMFVRVQTSGVFSFAFDPNHEVHQADIGAPLYVLDDQTVTDWSDTSAPVHCGRLEGLDGDDVWVRIVL